MRVSVSAGFVILLVLISGFVSGCSRDSGTAQADPEPVVSLLAVQVQPETVQRKVELVGTLEGQQEVTVSSEVSARVTAIRADLGDRVRQGQVLVELDTKEARLTVERQAAALAQVLAQLGVPSPEAPLPEAGQTSIVRKAAADLSEAKSNFERTKALVEKGVASKALLDTGEARYRVTEANYTAAIEQVRNLQAQVESLRAQLAIARKKVGDSTIAAPFSGTIRARMVEVGQYVKEQGAVMSVASMNPLKLRANVPEKWFPYVSPGARVDLTVEAYPDSFPGRVVRVAHALDPQSRTFAIEAHVDNAQERLRPGLFAHAILATSRSESVLRVPASAVISFYGVQKVYIVENERIREQVVKLGDRIGDSIEVTEGLTPGAWIATTELAKLRQGSRVALKRGA